MKVLVVGGVVVFLGYWMVQSPDSLASFTRDGASWAWDTAQTVFGSLIAFLGSLSK